MQTSEYELANNKRSKSSASLSSAVIKAPVADSDYVPSLIESGRVQKKLEIIQPPSSSTVGVNFTKQSAELFQTMIKQMQIIGAMSRPNTTYDIEAQENHYDCDETEPLLGVDTT